MSLPPILQDLPLPVIGSPMFIVSGPELVIAQCKAGIVGTFPALNARPSGTLEKWIVRIKLELEEYQKANPDKKVAPFGVNQICHPSNNRLQEDMEVCAKHEVPIIITSLQANQMVYDATHSYGGIILHDVTNIRHSKKALSMGADGLIAVCSGAGGHAGRLSPFALIPEIRQFFDGPLLLSGSIATGGAIAASLAMGPEADKSTMNFGSGGNTDAKAWKDIWGAGQGVGSVHAAPPVADVIAELKVEFDEACMKLASNLS